MFIYKITNKINGKAYIGQTINSIQVRWTQHRSEASTYRRNTPIHNAIRKYGKENFTIEEIDGANSLSELNYKEFLLIYTNRTIAPNGYNAKEGGNRPKYSKSTCNKMSVSAKNRANKKEHKDRMRFRNPMSNGSLIEARSKKVKEEGVYSKKNNPRYIELDIDVLTSLYYNKDKYWTHKNIADFFKVSVRVIDRRVKWLNMKRKLKKPNLSKTLKQKFKK